ncbi:hypothetical protein CAI21_19285 [Alkalilimnicola ehrlichii]|uniref:Signaling pathway modulator ZraP n=1 Tax=Alkalilimnicola ehrlichii TaxID=351052 RepID=A0A3E0WKU5_9GAMM|nr:periplasmic heavy metal sensor [Alkalilimnicola ehrlichii]RFA25379.1 hypothetical protein CAI21_19285 [Alkalilimnicola ehrlichii]RFA32555.1 hypothetical protein CAL65_19550 [Alkalilimnicola ehrlichii]
MMGFGRKVYWALFLLAIGSVALAQDSRALKALTPEEVEGFLAGQGMGFANVAELNGYPGPRHVLELAQELSLSDEQREMSKALFDAMRAETSRRGSELVAKEHELQQLFTSGQIDDVKLNAAVQEIARLRGVIRESHLRAHLRQAAILTEEQTARYMELRHGDRTAAEPSATSHDHHHHH